MKKGTGVGRAILLVEDEESLNRAVSLKLTKEGYTVYSALSVREAETLWHRHEIMLVICDIGLPDSSGLDFCEKLRRESDVLFLFLTAMSGESDIMKGYRMGADDYITKPFYLPALISKVNAIMKRFSGAAEPDTIVSGSIALLLSEQRVKKNGEYLNLTAKEYKLLAFFMQNPMRILTKNQLLEAIWDIDGNFVDENTLAVNIRRLREKIEDDPSRPAYIKSVRGLGYLFEKNADGERCTVKG